MLAGMTHAHARVDAPHEAAADAPALGSTVQCARINNPRMAYRTQPTRLADHRSARDPSSTSATDTACEISPAMVATSTNLRVLTVNTHKGMAAWNRRYMLGELRDAAHSTAADIVFLQEVIGATKGSRRGAPSTPHYEFLADSLWPEYAYGRNSVSAGGHHGNAVLSRHPISAWRNHDATISGESRGLLHCVLAPLGVAEVHVVCVHLGLLGSHRARQLQMLCELITRDVPADAPLIVAGDFNDWRQRADDIVHRLCGLQSVFTAMGLASPSTFPARLPVLRLDRIYVRNFTVRSACVLSSLPWPHLSDHLPVLAEVAT